MKKILSMLLFAGLAGGVHAAALVGTTYTTDTSVGETQYFLEGATGGTTATWTINPGVTVTGGRYFIGSTSDPDDGLATFVVDGGGTLNIDRIGTYNLRLGQNGDANSEGGALVVKNGSSVLMTGTTASAFQQNTASFITLDGIGSTFQWYGTWDAVNSKIQGQSTPSGDIPLSVTGGTLQITSAGGFTTATVIGNATPAPPVWSEDPIEDTAFSTKAYSSTLVGKASDPNGDPITFSKSSGPAWLSVASNGLMSGSPAVGDEGSSSFVVVATDVDGSTPATLNILVSPGDLPPVWSEDPIEDTAFSTKAYFGTLVGKASDPHGDPIAFSKSSGPAWLTVASNGLMSGSPAVGDEGSSSFVVVATDVDGSTPATLNILVSPGKNLLTLANADFEEGTTDGDNPVSWTVTEDNSQAIAVRGLGGTADDILAFNTEVGSGVQQSFDAVEATADTSGEYTVVFGDYGWCRNSSTTSRNEGWTISLINVTDGGVLASAVVPIAQPTVTSSTYPYDVVESFGSTSIDLTYDNTVASLVGDEVALRIENIVIGSYSWASSSYVDDISVTIIAGPQVTLSPASGVLRSGEGVTITPDDPADAIYYTLDGSTPNTGSFLYVSPVELPSGGVLKARAYKDGDVGFVSTGYYISVPETLPNMVLIVADDLGFGDLSCNGAPTIYTPNLDKLARQGARFTQFTSCGPGDLANQYAWLTGRVARRGDLPALLDSGETGGLDSREWTLGESLRKAGYETAFVGAWHLGDTPGCTATNQGFQLFYGLPYRPDAVPAPPLVENTTIVDAVHNPSNLLAQLTARATTYIGAQGGPDPFLLVFQPPSLPATGTSLQGTYGNRVEALDSSIGELLDALESAGLTSNTLVVFCSDEGPDLTSATAPFGSAGIFMDGKTTTWEGGVRVPFIASWPGVIAPATDSYGVLWMPDLFSTLVDIADGHTPGDRPYDGTSRPLLLLAKQTQPDDETTIYLHRHNGTGYELQVVRKGAYKYHAAYQNSDPQNTFSTAAPLLFQLELDPIEYYNKASSLPSKVTELQAEAASYEATFVPAQLPPAKGPFIIAPELVVGDDGVGNPAFNSTIIRPRDSLNDHYHIQHCTNLVLSGWNNLPIEDYILSIIPQPVEEEVLEISVPFDDPEFSGPNNFIRILGERP